MAEIREVSEKDLVHVAMCHQKSFKGSFSASMGTKYLVRALQWYLAEDKAFIFCATIDGKIVGFCGGFLNDGSMATGSATQMAQFAFSQAVRALLWRPWLIFHPEIRKKYRFVIRNIWRKLSVKNKNTSPAPTVKKELEPMTGLISIGVDPAFQGKGVGSLLIREFERISASMGVSEMYLSVKEGNEQAIASYTKNGWARDSTREGLIKMTKKIDQE